MLRIAAGMIAPELGTVSALGLDPRRGRAAYQPQVSFLPAGDPGLHARLTVCQHLEFCARIALIEPARTREADTAALAVFDLEAQYGRVHRMSTGQRQRLRQAIALLSELLLLFDEPLTTLDADGAGCCSRRSSAFGRGGAVLWCAPTDEQSDVDLEQSLTLSEGRADRETPDEGSDERQDARPGAGVEHRGVCCPHVRHPPGSPRALQAMSRGAIRCQIR
jgi:ABC-type transport system involved in cytochrome c biogenesis ATPase subunit